MGGLDAGFIVGGGWLVCGAIMAYFSMDSVISNVNKYLFVPALLISSIYLLLV